MTTEYKLRSTSTAWTLAWASCGFALAAVPARSQEGELGTAIELDAYVVVANRFEMPIRQVGSSVEALDAYELGKGQDPFLLDSLRYVSGLYLRNNGGPGSAMGITCRGLSGNPPTVLLNGIELSNPSTGQLVNFGNLFAGNVSRVEVLKGPQSSLYGADALAGVISIDTLPADGLEQTRASFSYGAFDTRQFGLGHSGSKGKFSWSLDGNYYDSAGHSSQDVSFGPEWADDDAYENKNVSGFFRYAFDEETDVYLSTYYFDAYSEFDPGVPPVWGTPYADNYNKDRSFQSRLGSRFRLGEMVSNEASLSYSDVKYGSFTSSVYLAEGERYKADWQSTVSMSEGWRFVAGSSFEREEKRSDEGDRSRDNGSVFIENLFAVTPVLDVTLGGRFDDNSDYGSEATYRGTFSYQLEDIGVRLRGSYGSSFQAPTFIQLDLPWGNPELKAEYGHGWDLGLEKTMLDGRLFASATLFGYDIEDKIAWSSGTFHNISRLKSEGVETNLRWILSESLSLKAAYTYAEGEEDGSLEALRVPRNVYSLGVSWRGLGDRLQVNASGFAASSQLSTRWSSARQPGYEYANLATQYQLNETTSFWIRLNNVFDADYQEVEGYETPGRNLSAGVRLSY